MDRELAAPRRGYRDATPESTDDDRDDTPEKERELGCAGIDVGTRADTLGLNHHDTCERGADPPFGVTGGLDDLLDCWRCWYVASRRRENSD